MRRGARARSSTPRVHQLQSARGAGAGEEPPPGRRSSSSSSARTRARLTKSLTTRTEANLRVLALAARSVRWPYQYPRFDASYTASSQVDRNKGGLRHAQEVGDNLRP